MNLLLDMNIPPRWAEPLRVAGHQVQHWRDVGPLNASDATILAFARHLGLVVLTHDLDFGDILAATAGDAPSVMQLRTDGLDFAIVGPLLLLGLAAHADALDRGALITLDARRARVRMLPLVRSF
jgi:predicted nuclease of predicted toxin-antitoxin system